MATAALTRYTPEEYLALERHAEFKSEYIDGRIIAMTGAQRAHVSIEVNLVRELSTRLLDGPCDVFTANGRVKVHASGRYVYPDVSVACHPRFEDAHVDTLLNPVVIFEVLSESTERYDRGEKFLHYRSIESLQEYVLVSQDKCLVEHYTRAGEFWQLNSLVDLDATLSLSSVGLEIPLRMLYWKVLPVSSSPSTGGEG